MIKRIFNHQSKTVAKGAFIIAVFYILNGLLAIFRNALLASKFGASRELDIYYSAFRIPDFLYVILISGAISAAFIPLFAEKLSISKEKAWFFANNVLSVFALILSIGAFLVFIFSPLLSKLIAPGFSEIERNSVSLLTRIMMIQPILLGISNIIVGILQNFKKFFITSLSPIFYNLGIIIGILFFFPNFGLKGLAWGVVLGSLLHFLIQLPVLKYLNFKFQFLFNFTSDLKRVIKLMIPRVLSLISIQINFLFITIIASKLKEGSLAIFNFANDLQYLPQNIFAISFAISVFPVLSGLFKKPEKMSREIRKTIKNILFFIIPISILFFVLREQISGIFLGYGKFNIENIKLVSLSLGIFSFSMIAQSLLPLFVRIFFAIKNSIRPFLAGIMANIFNIILGIILSKNFGILGLVSAFAFSSWLNFILLVMFLKKNKEIKIFYKKDWFNIFRIVSISLFSGIISWLGINLLNSISLNIFNSIGYLGQGILGGILGIGTFLVFLKIFKAPELDILKNFFGFLKKNR
jgi:putative peptidoglycan lipid II flippase